MAYAPMKRLACSLVAVVVWCSATVSAQVRTPLTSATAFPVSIVSPDNAAATSINPSALGSLHGVSFTYSHVSAERDTSYANRSDAAWLAGSATRKLSLGGGLEFTRSNTAGLASTNGFVLGAAVNMWAYLSVSANWRFRSPVNGG